jgi:NhaA family Na+:H+ antiporter
MALFFLLIGLEVKREVVDGHLSKPSQVILPPLPRRHGGAGADLLVHQP